MTITLSEEAALWVRKTAAEKNTPVSRLIGDMIEREMSWSDDYMTAWRRWKAIDPFEVDAKNRLSRADIHARR